MSESYAYFVCSVCGSDDVQILNWTRPNSPHVVREEPCLMPEDGPAKSLVIDTPYVGLDMTWCGHCDAATPIRYVGPHDLSFDEGYPLGPTPDVLEVLMRFVERNTRYICSEDPCDIGWLDTMVDAGWIERVWVEDAEDPYYKLTPKGRATKNHFRARKQCLKCERYLLDPQMPAEHDERCHDCGDP